MAWKGYGGQQWQQNSGKSWQQNSAVTVQQARVASPAVAEKEVLSVFTKGSDTDEIVIRTLSGDYHESGNNHGRKTYMKKSEKAAFGTETVEVYIYFWDSRDGPAFEGWWFGNQVGGTQVWSHNSSTSQTPPASGWKIPWDGAVRPSLCVMNKALRVKQEAPSQGNDYSKGGDYGKGGGKDASYSTQAAANMTREVSAAARTAMTQAKAAVAAAGDGSAEVSTLEEASEALSMVVPQLSEALKKLEEQKQYAGDMNTKQQLTQSSNSLRMLNQQASQELVKVKAALTKATNDATEKAAMERDLFAFQVPLDEVTLKIQLAEDSVEKALITSDLIEGAGEDLEEAKHAVQQVELAVNEATKALAEARTNLGQKTAAARRLETESARQEMGTKLTELGKSLQEAQTKLVPLKSVREEFNQRQTAQKVSGEILTKLTAAELDVDRAEEATMLLAAGGNPKDLLPKAEQAAKKAHDHLSAVLGVILQKKRMMSKGVVAQELEKLEARCKQSQERIGELRNSHKEATERANCLGVVEDAEAKVLAVQEAVESAMDAEGPFLMGVDELPLDQTLDVIKACETAYASANSQMSNTRMFLATKLVEAKRFAEAVSKECQAKLKSHQTQLEAQTKKLLELKEKTASRKRKTLIRQAEREADKAFALVSKVETAAAPLEDDERLSTMKVQEIRAAADATSKAEVVASAAISKAREFITQRQLEAKTGKDQTEMSAISTALIKLQTKLGASSAEVSKRKQAAKSVEHKIQIKKSMEEAEGKVQAWDAKVIKLQEVVDAACKSDSDADVKAAEKAITDVTNLVLKQMERYMESLAKSPKDGSKEVATKMTPAVEAVKEKFNVAVDQLKAQGDKKAIASIIGEVQEKVKDAEAAVQSAVDAEAPFRGKSLPTAENAVTQLQALEKAVTAANSAANIAKTAIATKKVSAKRLADSIRASVIADLDKFQSQMEPLSKKMADMKSGMAKRKASIMKLEVEGLVSKMTTASSRAAEAVSSFGEKTDVKELKDAAAEANKALLEATETLVNAKATLTTRQRESKMQMTPDSSSQGEITKAMDTFFKLQAELEKHKMSLKNKEKSVIQAAERKAAAEIVAELTVSVDSLMSEGEKAITAAADLEKKDATEVEYAAVEKAELALQNVVTSAEQVLAKVKAQPNDSLKASSGAAEMRRDLAKLQMQIGSLQAKSQKQFNAIKSFKQKISDGAHSIVMDALRACAQGQKSDVHTLFKQWSASKETVPIESLKRQLGKLPEDQKEFTAKQLELGLGRYARTGMSQLAFTELLQTYMKCIKDIAITNSFDVKESKVIRKLGTGELIEVLETSTSKDSSGLPRLRCRAINDGTEGWISSRGNQGTQFLTSCPKPYYVVAVDDGFVLDDKFQSPSSASNASARRKLVAGEVVELLEGPRQEPAQQIRRARGKARKDGKVGWITASDELGAFVETTTQFVCRQSIALTAEFDIAKTGIIRKVETGEVLEPLGEEQDDETRGIARIKLKALKDNKEGWVTVRGNLGSAYVEKTENVSLCRRSVPLEARFNTGSPTLRQLEAGEVFEILEGPKTETRLGETRAKCRSVGTSGVEEGWLTLREKDPKLKPWQPRYRCKEAVALSRDPDSASKVVRKFEPAELIEALAVPFLEKSSGLLRVHCRAAKDDAVGYTTVRGNAGSELFEAIPSSDKRA